MGRGLFSLDEAPTRRVTALTLPSNQRLKLTACGRRLRRNAQWKFSILLAAPAGRSLSAFR